MGTFVGTSGNDVLMGTNGADTMVGLAGDDRFYVNHSGDQAVESAGEGNDTVFANVSFALGANQEIESLQTYGSSTNVAINLTGNEFAQFIAGNAADNFIDGKGGADAMRGYAGADTYYVDNALDTVTEAAAGGNDTVIANVSFALGVGQEIETLRTYGSSSTAAINFTGNEFVQAIFGNAAANVIDGKGGADSMRGYAGNDIYYVDNGLDKVIEAAGGGSDTVITNASFALGIGQEIETLRTYGSSSTAAINLTGNEFGQAIFGNAAANVIDGKGGVDSMRGYAGNDTYYVDNAGDAVIEAASGGNDSVAANVSYTLGVGQEIETLQTYGSATTAAVNLTGNEFAQTILGNAAANSIDGKGGADIMRGYAGNDTYYVDNALDKVIEAAGGGSDTVITNASFVLGVGQEIETLQTYGSSTTVAVNLTGNEFGQAIFGNAAANVIDGKGGADSMRGYAGNDTYYVDNGLDKVIEAAGGGSDSVAANVSYTLGVGQEIETLQTYGSATTAAVNLTGNEFAQTILGNAAANTIDGKGGADIMRGYAGDDIYHVDNAGDAVIEAAGGGTDTILASVSFTVAAGQQIEVLSAEDLLGTNAIDLTGNAFTQALYGNAGNNVLTSHLAGAALYGGLGADTLDSSGLVSNFYFFDTALGNGNIDYIPNLNGTIMLAGDAGGPFSPLATGQLAANMFVVGAAAADANDFLIYNPATGALLFDSDGNGAGAAVQFATLQTNLAGLNSSLFKVTGAANHAPAISSGTAANVDENVATSTIVYQAVATDSDGDRIFYSLGGADAARLTIDANGAVRLTSSPDFETKSSYAFTVIASDSAVSTSKAVTLTINDLADASTTPIINETASVNDSTGAAQAIDRNIFTVGANGDLPDPALPSATIHGSVSTDNDSDFYAITLQAGEKIILDVDHTTGSLDSFIRFYDSSGNELLSNDDRNSSDPGSNPPFDHNTDSYLSYRVATGGTYYFSVESFGDLNGDQDDDGANVGESHGDYSLNVSIGPPATEAEIMNEDVDALISGLQWSTTALSYGFPTLTSQYPDGMEEVDSPSDHFEAFNATQQAVVGLELGLISQVSLLTFTQNTANPGQTHIRYAMSDQADVAYAYFPDTGPGQVGGTAWFNNSSGEFDNPIKGNYAWMGILHETGHALGLKHGHEAPAVSFDHDSVEYTVMTYRSYPGDDLSGYSNEQWGYPQSLMMLDIAALQRMYGANFATNSGDSVYRWSTTTGEMSINNVGQGAPGGNRVFETIWDGGGQDTYDLSNRTTAVTIDLRPGEWTLFAPTAATNVQLAHLGLGHDARGNVANALQYEDDPRSLIENAIGGSEHDILIANQAANHLTGGGSGDHFQWLSVADGSAGAVDHVTDFQTLSDNIDLSALDIDPTTAVRDAFHSIGSAAFSGAAGELRQEVISGSMNLFGDANGDGVADFHIILDNVTSLAGTDIIF